MSISNPKYRLGALVRDHRTSAGLSQYELAEKAGVSQGTVTMLERGFSPNPSFGTAHLIATALGVPTAKLLEAFVEDWRRLLQDRGGHL